MTSQQILQSDVLDILFEHRNKLYGAYTLRKGYNQQLLKATLFAIGPVFLLFVLCRPTKARMAASSEPERTVEVTQIVPHEPKKPEPPKLPDLPKTPPVKQQIFTTNIAITEKVNNPLPPQDIFETAVVSDITADGRDVASAIQPPPVKAETTAKEDGGGKPEAPKEVVPDKQPQFPGGMQAWSAFLSRNLRSPQDLESGEKRVVVIRFHVAEDGSVTGFQVEKSAGTAFDDEVIRVLKKMPRWTPALKAGLPVSVSFTQPVTFVGVEE